jgi:hypothetical protein
MKFILPTVVINTLPPSYASTMTPVQALPAAPHVPPAAPDAPVAPTAPPAQVFHPPPDPALPSAPPPTPTIQAQDIDENEDEVEKTITPHRIIMPMTPQSSQP